MVFFGHGNPDFVQPNSHEMTPPDLIWNGSCTWKVQTSNFLGPTNRPWGIGTIFKAPWVWSYNPGLWCQVAFVPFEARQVLYLVSSHDIFPATWDDAMLHTHHFELFQKKLDLTQVLLVVIPILLWIAKVAYQILMVIVIHRQLFLTRTIFLDRMSVYASGKKLGLVIFFRKVGRCLGKEGSKNKKRKKTEKKNRQTNIIIFYQCML